MSGFKFRPKSVRYRPMEPKDFKAWRRLAGAAQMASERCDWVPSLLAEARRLVSGKTMPKAQAVPGSEMGKLLALVDRWHDLSAAERSFEGAELARLASVAIAILDAEEHGASPARTPRADIHG